VQRVDVRDVSVEGGVLPETMFESALLSDRIVSLRPLCVALPSRMGFEDVMGDEIVEFALGRAESICIYLDDLYIFRSPD
jgi:hypothetical protein